MIEHSAGRLAVGQADKVMLESESKFRMAFENCPEAIFLADAKSGTITDVNRAACELMSMAKEELLGLHHSALHPTEEVERYRVIFEEHIRQGTAITQDVYVQRPSGELIPVDISTCTMEVSGEQMLQAVFREMTERKRAEEAYRAVVEHSLQGLAIVQDFQIVFANQALADITGYTVEELLSLSPEEVQAGVHPEDRDLVWRRFQDRLSDEPVPHRYEYRVIKKDGTVIWLEMFASHIEYRGKPAVQAAMVDITERKRAEEALSNEQEKFRLLAEESPLGVSAIRQDGHYEYVNRAFIELFGYTLEDIPTGREWFAKAYPDPAYRDQVMSAWSTDLKEADGGAFRPRTFTVRSKDGSEKVIQFRAVSTEGGKQFVIYEDITQRKRAEEEIRQRNEELAAMNAIARTVAGSLDLEEILDRALRQVLDVIGVEMGTIRLLDAETGVMALMAHRGLSEEYVHSLRQLRVSKPAMDTMLTRREPVVIEDVLTEPLAESYPVEAFEREQVHSLAVVPLTSKEELMGFLAVMSREPHEFTAQDVELLSSMGSQIGMAVENAGLYQEQRRRLSEMEALRQTTLDITRQLDMSRLLRSIVERAAALVGAKGGDLYLYHPHEAELELVVSYYLDKDYTGTRLQVGEGLSGQVVLTGEPLIVEDYASMEDRSKKYQGASFRGVMAVPLKWGDKIVGVVNVTDVDQLRTFTERDLWLMELFASQAAIAIENARLHEETVWRVEELSAIEEIVHELSSTLDFRKVIQLVLDKAIEATDASGGTIAVLDEERTELPVFASQGYPVDEALDYVGERFSIEKGIAGRVVRTGEVSLVGDVSQDPDYVEVLPGTQSQLTVPIMREDKVAGVILLQSPRLRGFGKEHAGFVQHLAKHAAVAMENARLYERLWESEERYRTYVENVPDAIWESDAEGRFTYWSPQTKNLIGYTREQLLGHTPYEFLVHADDVDRFRSEVSRMIREGREEHTLCHRASHADGSLLHIETSIRPVWDDTGEVIKFQGVARDISERVHLQAQLIQSAKLSGVGQMIAGVAHELNNPLTTVMGYAQLLQASDAEESVKEDLEKIHKEALRAQRIVQNLLTFARQKKPKRSPVQINEAIESTLALRRYQLKVDDVELVTELADNLPWTMADSYQLQQVFLNIVNNAHQAMADQGAGGVLTVRSELLDGDVIRISFADTGPGMPSEVLDKVFDPFFTTKDVGVGTGLGLSVSHGIIQEHGGRVWAESEPGQGATFFVELPVRSWVEAVTVPSPAEESGGMPSKGRRILIVDDERSIVDLIVRALNDSGYRAEGVTSARAALDRLHHERYDLMICDIRMPDMGGPEWEREVRAMDPELVERIIFITGDLLGPATQAFLERWQGRHIKKPFDVEELRALVLEALSEGAIS